MDRARAGRLKCAFLTKAEVVERDSIGGLGTPPPTAATKDSMPTAERVHRDKTSLEANCWQHSVANIDADWSCGCVCCCCSQQDVSATSSADVGCPGQAAPGKGAAPLSAASRAARMADTARKPDDPVLEDPRANEPSVTSGRGAACCSTQDSTLTASLTGPSQLDVSTLCCVVQSCSTSNSSCCCNCCHLS